MLSLGILGRLWAALAGPAAGALAVAVVAASVIAAGALGLTWLRGDAARTATAAERAACNAEKLEAELALAKARSEAWERATRHRDETIAQMTAQRREDEAQLSAREQERQDAIAAAQRWEAAAGRRDGPVFRADDPWLRSPAPAAAGQRR